MDSSRSATPFDALFSDGPTRAGAECANPVQQAAHQSWQEWLFEEERPRALFLLWFVIPVSIAYFLTDLRFEGVERLTYMGLRLAYLASFCVALAALYRVRRPRLVKSALGAGSLLLALFLCIRYGQGHGLGGVPGHLAADVVVILGIFMVPQFLAVQVVAATMIAAASAWDYLVFKEVSGSALTALVTTLTLALAMGLAGALALRRGLRERYLALRELHQLRDSIPICAWCNNIRDDAGVWQRLESYFQQHADVAFTHGICPTCVDRLERRRDGQEELAGTGPGTGGRTGRG